MKDILPMAENQKAWLGEDGVENTVGREKRIWERFHLKRARPLAQMGKKG